MGNPPSATPWGVHLRLLGMVMFWGASYSWAKTVVITVPPITAATLRFFLASFTMLVWLHQLRRTRLLLTITTRQWAGLALAAMRKDAHDFLWGVESGTVRCHGKVPTPLALA